MALLLTTKQQLLIASFEIILSEFQLPVIALFKPRLYC